MPYTLKSNKLFIRNMNTGSYESGNVITDQTTAEQIALLESAASGQMTAIEEKAAEALSTIPDEYEEVSSKVNEIASEFSNSTIYNTGDYVFYNNQLYRCKHTMFKPMEWTDAQGWFEDAKATDDINVPLTDNEMKALIDEAFIRAQIEPAMSSIENVSSVRVYANASNQTDSRGIPPNSVQATFSGGTAKTIAAAVKDSLPAGMQTYGTLPVSVGSETVYLMRSTTDDVSTNIEIIPGDGYDSTSCQEAIKQAVVQYADKLKIGDGVYSSDVYNEIMKINDGSYTVSRILFGFQGSSGYNLEPVHVANRGDYHRYRLSESMIHIVEVSS